MGSQLKFVSERKKCSNDALHDEHCRQVLNKTTYITCSNKREALIDGLGMLERMDAQGKLIHVSIVSSNATGWQRRLTYSDQVS